MSAPLWMAADAAAATGGRAEGWEAVTGVSIDTRELAPGDLFVALAGDNRDGHAFVAEALARGAGAAMVTHRPEGVGPDAPLLVVGDTLEGLCGLAAAARARSGVCVIGVTGSVGKTSTKDMLRAMLAPQGRTHAATRSFNNHWGVPLTLARMPADTEYSVIEIGMNHAGEIRPLSRLARPHVALITAIEAVHLENLGSIEAIADAKAEIFEGLEPGGSAILPADNEHIARLTAAAGAHRVIGFGTAAPDFRLGDVHLAGGATVVAAQIHGAPVMFKLATPGAHFAANALGALAAVEAAGGDLARAILGLAAWTPPEGRGAAVRIALGPCGADGTVTLLDDSYNANPASVGAALAVLSASAPDGGRRLAILGDMLELGPEEATLHARLAEHPALDGVDLVHTCGPRMRHLHDALPQARRGTWAEDSDALAKSIPKLIDAGDVVMVKGSLGARMTRIVTAIKGLDATSTQHVDRDA